jgi:hypothetical protein
LGGEINCVPFRATVTNDEDAMNGVRHRAGTRDLEAAPHSADGCASVLNAAAQRARKNPLDTTAAGPSPPIFPTLLAVVVIGSTA